MAPSLRFTALAALLIPYVLAAPSLRGISKLLNAEATDVVQDSYIVVYKESVTEEAKAEHVATVNSILRKRDISVANAGIHADFGIGTFQGYSINADAALVADIAASPDVAYIEKDGVVHTMDFTTQSTATYGLSRLSHRDIDTASSYVYDDVAGQGATVYIVDTGIQLNHTQFEGRAKWGANFITKTPVINSDENGHGTHVAGTIGGSTYGVAKKVSLVAVKVLDKSGSGSNTGVIQGINWVAQNAGPRSVLSMSLGGTKNTAVNKAVEQTVAAGVVVVVAAGNDGRDASNTSPASEKTAITVGAIDNTDTIAKFSNYGPFVDIFGPGVSVLSSWISDSTGSTTKTNTISGTSMATPHIAGLAAYLLSIDSSLSTPDLLFQHLNKTATVGKIKSISTINLNTTKTVNLIAFNGQTKTSD